MALSDTKQRIKPDENILVVDDEQPFLESMKLGLRISGFTNVRLENDPRCVVTLLDQGHSFDVAVLDVTMPHIDGLKLLELIKQKSPNTECLMLTAHDKAKIAVECMRKGAYDYLTKPIAKDDLVFAVNRALERKRLLDIINLPKTNQPAGLKHPHAFESIITASTTLKRLLMEAELHAASNVPVLITGESGTGKELLARSIHLASPRSGHPFSAINMASMSPTLFDAEFFGHHKGAFTGAERNRAGYLEHSDKGTLFLDEIGHLPFDLQGKLLRVLQEGEFIKLGSSTPTKTDVRIVAATNVDIEKLVKKNQFRLDLYYRLKCAWLHIPPLRERKEDIPLLINHFLNKFTYKQGACQIEADAVEILQAYDYPGNVRELQSIIQTGVNLAEKGIVTVESLPRTLPKRKLILPQARSSSGDPGVGPDLEDVIRAHVVRIYNETGNNKTRAAKLLGVGLSTLRRKLASYGIE